MPLTNGQRVLHNAHGWATVHADNGDATYTLVCANNSVISAREADVVVPPATEGAPLPPTSKKRRANHKAELPPEV